MCTASGPMAGGTSFVLTMSEPPKEQFTGQPASEGRDAEMHPVADKQVK